MSKIVTAIDTAVGYAVVAAFAVLAVVAVIEEVRRMTT